MVMAPSAKMVPAQASGRALLSLQAVDDASEAAVAVAATGMTATEQVEASRARIWTVRTSREAEGTVANRQAKGFREHRGFGVAETVAA